MKMSRAKNSRQKSESNEGRDGTLFDDMRIATLLARNKDITRAYVKEKKINMQLHQEINAMQRQLAEKDMAHTRLVREYELICNTMKSAAPTMIEVLSLFIRVTGAGNATAVLRNTNSSATEEQPKEIANISPNNDIDYGKIASRGSIRRPSSLIESDDSSDSDVENKSPYKSPIQESPPKCLSTIMEESVSSSITVRGMEKSIMTEPVERSSLFCNANDSLADFSQFSPPNNRHSTQIPRLSVCIERYDDVNLSLRDKTITPSTSRQKSMNVTDNGYTPENTLEKRVCYLPTPSMSCLGDIDPNVTPTRMFGEPSRMSDSSPVKPKSDSLENSPLNDKSNLLKGNPSKKRRNLKTRSGADRLPSLQQRISNCSSPPKRQDSPQASRPGRAAKPKQLKEVSLRKKLRRS